VTEKQRRPRTDESSWHPLTKRVAVLAAGLLLAGGVIAPVGSAAAASAAGAVKPAAVPAHGGYKAGRYIVTLRDEPAATYDGGVKSFGATRSKAGKSLDADSAKVEAYAGYLKTEQKSVAASVGAKIVSSYTLSLNGFSGKLTADQATALSRDSRVESIQKDELLKVQNAETSTDFLKLSGSTGVWSTLGGIAKAGDGVVIADIDTGIAPENPSFAGDPLGTVAGDAPYLDGTQTVYNKGDGTQFRGECVTGEQFTASDCSTKIIGARYFVDNFGLDSIADAARGEYVSPRDGAGHGSHTASTAAGDNGVEATVEGNDMGAISGVAPAAKLAIYKVCWTGLDVGSDGCSTGDIVAAIDQAVADNVDVINFSIGGGAAETTTSASGMAFLGAAAAGIFVSASAGNDGPKASTLDNAAPWITTVAAASIPSYDATVKTGDGTTYLGGSITLPKTGTISGALVAAKTSAIAGVSSPQLCGPSTLDSAKVSGKVVLCERGTYDRVAKSAEVKRAGGIGMILVNPTNDSIDLDTHTVPTIHLNSDSYAGIRAYAATAGATVTFESGNTTGKPGIPTPQVASFSSRGPVVADGGDILKPDITAPGVAILADGPNAAGKTPTYEFMSGTSMSAPHITGLAALYLGKRPNASPSEIKSAMMTTAYNTLDAAGDEIEDPFVQGAGHVDPTSYFEPGLLYLNGMSDWKSYIQALGQIDYAVTPVDPTELNLPSISIGSLAGTETVTRTVTSTQAGTFTAQPVTMAGVDVTVNPSTMTFTAAGQTKSYTVTFDRTDAELDQYTTGYLRWKSGATVVTSPLAVQPVLLSAPKDASGSGNSGSVTIPVLGGDAQDIPVVAAGLTKGEVITGTGKIGGHASYAVTAPTGTTFMRLALNAADDDADFDLHVYTLDGFGGSYQSHVADSENADETVDVENPDIATYIVDVTFESGATDLDYTLTSYLLGGSPSVGDFTSTPDSLAMQVGKSIDVTASWTGLEPGGSYLGQVYYDGTGISTYVTVTSADRTTPAPSEGTLAAVARPDWVRQAHGLGIYGSGLVPGEAYSIYLDGASTPSVTGFASNAGNADRYTVLSEDIPLGQHSFELRADSGSVSSTFMVSPIVLTTVFALPDADYDGSPTLAMDAIFGGKGTLQFLLKDHNTGKVYIDETDDVEGNPILDSVEAVTQTVRVDPGTVDGTVWSIDENGDKTQEQSFTIAMAPRAASSIAFTKDVDDPQSVDFTFANNTDSALYPIIEYKTCAGPIVFANQGQASGEDIKVFDLRGITSVSVQLGGKTVASYANGASERCSKDALNISQPFWTTLTPSGDRAKPIKAVITNRYAAYSYGYDLRIGNGSAILTDQISFEAVPVDYTVTETGAVSERTTLLEENKAYWMTARYETLSPNKHVTAIRRVVTAPVTLADLAPEPPAKTLKVAASAGLHLRGAKITVATSGLIKAEPYTISIGGIAVKSGTASSTGAVKVAVTIPAKLTEGKHTVVVTGSTAKRTGKVSTYVITKSKKLTVTLSPKSSVQANRTLVIKVTHLAPHEKVVVMYAGHRVSASNATASATGTYRVTLASGYGWGKKAIAVRGLTKTRIGKATITVMPRR
jgi:subtilisin family serine protease